MRNEIEKRISRKTFLRQFGLGLGALGTGVFFPADLAAEGIFGKSTSPKEVIVVGAGLAGLSAAWALKKAGHKVTVLEARDRPGGRVSTVSEPFSKGLYAEEGAAAYSESYTEALKLIDEFGLEKIPWSMPEDAIVYHLNGKRIVVGPGEAVEWPYELSAREQRKAPMELVKMYIIDTLPEEVGDPDLWSKAPVVNLDKLSLEAYLKKQGASEGAISLLQNTQWFAALPSETSGLSMAMSDFGLFMGGMPFVLKGGNDLLPKELAKRMTGELQYGVEVQTIKDDKKRINVQASKSGERRTFSGDSVVVAVPLKVLERISFEPPLPAVKKTAIQKMPVLDLTRVFLEMEKPFWKNDGLAGIAFTDLPVMQVNAYHNTGDQLNKPAMLESYVAGDYARELSQMKDKQAMEQQLRSMEKVHPGAEKHFKGGYVKAWSKDPYALGGPSWPGPGDVTGYLEALKSSHGNVHFAGEHTSILRSTMEGAIRSGIRAASEVSSS